MRSATAPILAIVVWALSAVGEDNFHLFNDPPKRPETRPSENLALGSPYTLDPTPNYHYCTDAGDREQLTDGVYSEGYFWVQKSTVGWQNCRPIVITLDLGNVRPIRGASFHTAAGRAGVEWPLAVYLFAADQDKQFYEVGELVTLSAKNGLPPPEGYGTHRYWMDDLRTHGRYMAFVISAQPYAFVDEIEVYAGEPSWTGLPREGGPTADIKAHMLSLAIRESVRRRLRSDITVLRGKTDDATIPDDVRRVILGELDAVELGVDALPEKYGDDFRAVLPLNPLHARVFRAQGRLWGGKRYAPLTVWQSALWDPLSHLADPSQEGGAAVRVHMMSNEYRAGAFNLSNAAQQDAALELRIAGLPGGVNPAYITVYEVAWTDTHAGLPVAAALPKAARGQDAYLINVPSGLTRQVWLTVHPTDLEPGTYHGQIQLRGGGADIDVPLTLHLYPLRFPDQPALHFGGWDYTNADRQYEATPENRDILIAHLREYFVDSPWGTSAALPHGQYDGQGMIVAEPDTVNFDEWLRRWPGAAQYCVFASVGRRAAQFEIGTPQFVTVVKQWVTFWADHARERGLEPEQVALLLVDEPHSAEQDAVILAWANAIREADTGVRIWEDPTYRDMREANQDMVTACHVLCPNRMIFLRADPAYRDYFAERRERGATLEFYSCSGPARLLDPYAYYRLQAWTCWQYGATASYFWAFGDAAGASSWNEYAAKRNAYTPLFLDAASVTAGKHLEACREGIEDYEYFVMLREAIADAGDKGVTDEILDRARVLLDEMPARVCDAGGSDSFRWDEQLDRTMADEARVQILETLVALHEASY